MKVVQPANWPRPQGYSNGVIAAGRTLYVAGMVGWNESERFETDDFVGQARQALANVVTVLAAAGARPEHIVRLTWFIADTREYAARRSDLGRAYREVIGRHYPPMTVVAVGGFVEAGAKLEIEATAVVPEPPLTEGARTA